MGSQLYKIPSAAESPDIKTSSRENILQMSDALISPPLASTWTRNKFADKPVDKVMKRQQSYSEQLFAKENMNLRSTKRLESS